MNRISRFYQPLFWSNGFLPFKSFEVAYRKSTISSVQSLSRVRLFVTPCTAARQASLSITISWSLLKLMSIKKQKNKKNSCLLSRWCHPTISSSVVPFSFCLQSFSASGSFLMSQLFASSGQNTGLQSTKVYDRTFKIRCQDGGR